MHELAPQEVTLAKISSSSQQLTYWYHVFKVSHVEMIQKRSLWPVKKCDNCRHLHRQTLKFPLRSAINQQAATLFSLPTNSLTAN